VSPRITNAPTTEPAKRAAAAAYNFSFINTIEHLVHRGLLILDHAEITSLFESETANNITGALVSKTVFSSF